MRQDLKYLTSITNYKIFPYVEIDADIITVKMFIDVFDGNDENIPPQDLLITPQMFSNNSIYTRHTINFGPEVPPSIYSGDIFNTPGTSGRYFKFGGAAQIKRSENSIKISTSIFDNRIEDSTGFPIEVMREWDDCALWSFDYNFIGRTFMSPYNVLLETKESKLNYVRHETVGNYTFQPVVSSQENDEVNFSVHEFKKRIMSMFLLDKDMPFTDASLYFNTCYRYYFGGDLNYLNFKESPAMLNSYDELPIPQLHILSPPTIQRDNVVKVALSLYTDYERILDEDGGNIYMEDESVLCLESPEDLIKDNGEIDEKYIEPLNVTLYVENDGGYISKRKINLDNGKGELILRALDNVVGDEIEIKSGFKNFSNLNSIKLQVTS